MIEEHKTEIVSSFLEPGFQAECSCGWKGTRWVPNATAVKESRLHMDLVHRNIQAIAQMKDNIVGQRAFEDLPDGNLLEIVCWAEAAKREGVTGPGRPAFDLLVAELRSRALTVELWGATIDAKRLEEA